MNDGEIDVTFVEIALLTRVAMHLFTPVFGIREGAVYLCFSFSRASESPFLLQQKIHLVNGECQTFSTHTFLTGIMPLRESMLDQALIVTL